MTLSREDIFAAWAPADSPWSVWAKPVLFANTPLDLPERVPDLPDVGMFPHVRDAAIIVDLNGVDSALFGLALAQMGYQPVPLYNSGGASGALIDMEAIASILTWGVDILRRSKRKPDAPPAFLLNADRMDHGDGATLPGRYDNRWCVVPQDMPSADFLKSAGIKRVILVSPRRQDDLSHILHRYQEARLDLSRIEQAGAASVPLEIPKPASYKSMWYRIGVLAGLRRNSAGGFGGLIPDPGSAGGSGWG